MTLRCFCVITVIMSGVILDVIAKNKVEERCGVSSSKNKFPWLVIIEHEYSNDPIIRIHCTGALVSNKHVVSSAICFDRDVFSGTAKWVRLGDRTTITKGEYTRQRNVDSYTSNGTIIFQIETVTTDPEYSSPSLEVSPPKQHDMALITLKDVVPYTRNIRPICLPSADVTLPEATDQKLYLTGVSDKDPNIYQIRQAAMSYMDKAECQQWLRSYVPVVEDNLCATINEDINPCAVNSLVSGGILMNKRGGTYELIGLGIFEGSCLSSVARYRIFTHLFLYRNWIRSKITEWACGTQGSKDRFSWLAAIEFKYRDDPIEVRCSGALISRRHVVANAECFHKTAIPGMARSVRLGLHNTIDGRNCTKTTGRKNCTDSDATRIPIKAVINHPEFTRSFKLTGIHDIALAILSELVTYTDVIRPICLPSADITQLPAIGRELYVNEFYYKGSLTEIANHSAMTYVDKEGCREVLNNYDMILPEDLLCAKRKENIEPNWCLYPGDLLINKREDGYELVGLVQLSYCGTSKVFTNVFRSLDWIRSVIPEWTDGCGRRKVEHIELIFKGVSSKAGDWPWHVAVYKLELLNNMYICGGTLISKKMVLTAAHCATENGVSVNPELLNVILGKYNLLLRDLQSQERYVHSVIVHEHFAPTRYLRNDIALLKLRPEATYNDYVQPACIWSSDVYDNLPSNRDFGTVVGWGYDDSNALSSTLKETNMPRISALACMRKNPIFYANVLDNDKKFCAGWANGTSPCNGDSGGGFFVFAPDKANTVSSTAPGSWYIRGIVSTTPAIRNLGRCDPNQYVVFTDLANYTDWIQTHLEI